MQESVRNLNRKGRTVLVVIVVFMKANSIADAQRQTSLL